MDLPRTELKVGGEPVHLRLTGMVPVLARRIVLSFVDTIPIYRQLPDEEIQGDIARVVEDSLLLVARLLGERRDPLPEELSELVDSAARRAEEGVPLEAVIAGYHLGMRQLWDALVEPAAPGDLTDVLSANRLVMRFLGAAVEAICEGYLLERQSMLNQEQHARDMVTSVLLRGESPAEPAANAGIRLADLYLVMPLRLGEHPDEAERGPGGPIAGRRKLRRVRAALERFTAEPVLSVLDHGGGIVLVPVDSAGTSWDWGTVGTLVADIGRAAGVDITATAELAAPDGVKDAAQLARQVLDVVRAFGRPPGLYRLPDVLLEYQLTRPGEGRTALAALLEPLADHPDLAHTLDVYAASRFDRRGTAAALHVHPNTVDYRLRRVAHLTGLNPADPVDMQRLAAALAARRLIAPQGLRDSSGLARSRD
ncbi:PucR family transcriptional regulator [Streptomyces sp. NPDC058464]|uniref:PucR family transcriptional regulator n=1 Tax=Streptomyces sp. NPDC058464 TaxID=3346511 RepID=UPI003655A7AC